MRFQQITAVALVTLLWCVSFTNAWSPGDLVPVNVFLRINGSYASTSSTPSTAIPLDFCPRFSWNKIVQVPSADYGSKESDVSIKFEIGRGVNRHTNWMALKELPGPTNGITAPKHLTMVTFHFGYQVGVFGRFTSFKAAATYSATAHEVITIKYVWDEHRSYNPNTALGLVSCVSVVVIVALLHRFTSAALSAPSVITVVRERSD